MNKSKNKNNLSSSTYINPPLSSPSPYKPPPAIIVGEVDPSDKKHAYIRDESQENNQYYCNTMNMKTETVNSTDNKYHLYNETGIPTFMTCKNTPTGGEITCYGSGGNKINCCVPEKDTPSKEPYYIEYNNKDGTYKCYGSEKNMYIAILSPEFKCIYGDPTAYPDKPSYNNLEECKTYVKNHSQMCDGADNPGIIYDPYGSTGGVLNINKPFQSDGEGGMTGLASGYPGCTWTKNKWIGPTGPGANWCGDPKYRKDWVNIQECNLLCSKWIERKRSNKLLDTTKSKTDGHVCAFAPIDKDPLQRGTCTLSLPGCPGKPDLQVSDTETAIFDTDKPNFQITKCNDVFETGKWPGDWTPEHCGFQKCAGYVGSECREHGAPGDWCGTNMLQVKNNHVQQGEIVAPRYSVDHGEVNPSLTCLGSEAVGGTCVLGGTLNQGCSEDPFYSNPYINPPCCGIDREKQSYFRDPKSDWYVCKDQNSYPCYRKHLPDDKFGEEGLFVTASCRPWNSTCPGYGPDPWDIGPWPYGPTGNEEEDNTSD